MSELVQTEWLLFHHRFSLNGASTSSDLAHVFLLFPKPSVHSSDISLAFTDSLYTLMLEELFPFSSMYFLKEKNAHNLTPFISCHTIPFSFQTSKHFLVSILQTAAVISHKPDILEGRTSWHLNKAYIHALTQEIAKNFPDSERIALSSLKLKWVNHS